jgi:hypothetical protein
MLTSVSPNSVAHRVNQSPPTANMARPDGYLPGAWTAAPAAAASG